MTKLTRQRTDIMLSSIADGHSIVDVCEATGVSRTAFYQRCKKDEEFAAAVKEAQQYSAEKALEELILCTVMRCMVGRITTRMCYETMHIMCDGR